MVFLRIVFLTLILLIGVLFTLGYSLFSIINFKSKLFNAEIFIDNINITFVEINETINYKYSDLDINSNYKLILSCLYYGCIVTSCFIAAGIIVSYLRMKFISKILFIIAQIFMTTLAAIIVFIYYSSSFIKSILPNYTEITIPEDYNDINTSYGTGGLLLIISSLAMIVIYCIYSFIG